LLQEVDVRDSVMVLNKKPKPTEDEMLKKTDLLQLQNLIAA
jgi:hypothetical protein